MVALVLVSTRRSFPVEPVLVVLVPEGASDGVVEMPWGGGPERRAGGPAGGRAEGGPAVPQPTAPSVVPDTIRPAGPPARPGGEGPGQGPPGAEGRRAEETGRPGGRLLGARFGDGRLWVRPWDAIAAAIAGAGRDSLDAAGNAALMDSVISARVTAFLEELPPDSFAVAGQPSWVTEINGQKWGLDGSWIYLGGLKIPSAILALIPLPQGNYDQSKRAADLQRIREDIMFAARRAESAAQFKEFVKETRERKDAEREAKKNQRVKPDSIRT
jgi:hypothetical protein